MTPRLRARMRPVAIGLIAFAGFTALLPGCDPRQAMYFLQPFEQRVGAKCPSLKGKRVVVLALAVAGSQNDYQSVDSDITNKLVAILRKEVKKIDIVDPEKVRNWARNKPNLTDPSDAARAFEADVVIFLEIQKFQVQNPQDLGQLLKGESNIHVQVNELAYPKDDRGRPMSEKPKESNLLYETDLVSEFPVNGGRPIDATTSPAQFKNAFVKIVVDELSWLFIGRGDGDDIQDTRLRD